MRPHCQANTGAFSDFTADVLQQGLFLPGPSYSKKNSLNATHCLQLTNVL